MDFENMKRKELQALCKEHGIPANLTNLEMVNKLSSLLKVNDEKPLTRGRSCLKVLDDDRESDVVNRMVKKVKFSPDNEVIEFTRSAQVKRRGRRKSMLYKNDLNVGSDGLNNVGILDSPVGVTIEKKGAKRHVKDSVSSTNEGKGEVGVTTRRSLRTKEVVIQENEGVNDGLRTSRRVRSRKNGKESAEDMEELDKSTGEKGIDGAEKRDKKVTFVSECTKSETKAKETKRETRRKSMAHNQTLHVQNEEEVVEKPALVTRSRNLKPVEDNVGNKRNRTRGKEVIEISEELVCTEFVESSVEVVKDEVRVNTRRSQQNSVVEPSKKAMKRSGRVANKEKGAKLTDDISKDKMVTRGRTRNQSKVTVEASTSESGTKIVEPKEKLEVVLQLEEPAEVPVRRSDRRKSVFPLEKLRGDEVAAKEKRIFLNANDDEPRNKGTKEETQKVLKRSKRLATQDEDSILVKDDIAENIGLDRGRGNRGKSVGPSLEKVRSDEVAVVKEKRNLNANDDETRSKGTKEETQKALKRSKRLATQVEDSVLAKDDTTENEVLDRGRSNRRKSVVPSLEKERSDEVVVVKEKRNLSANDAEIRSKDTKEEPQKALKRSKRLATQVEDSVLVRDDIAENKVLDRGRSSRRKSVVPSLEKERSDEVVVVKEKRNLSANDAEIRSKDTKEEPQTVAKRSKRLAKQVEDPVLARDDISETKLEERRHSRRNAAKANVDTKTLDKSVQEETSVVREERRRSGRSAARHTLAAVSDEKKENGDNKLTMRNRTVIQETDSLKQSTSSSKASVEAAVVEKTSTARKKQQGRLKRSNVEVEVPMPEGMEIVKEPDNRHCIVSGSEGTMSFSRSSLNELKAVTDDVNIVLAGTKDEAPAELRTLADKLNEEGPIVDANASQSENNSTSECLPFSEAFNSNARPEENLVEELLQSDHKEPTSKDLCPSSVLADDAVPNDITSDKQEHGAITADNAEEFDTGLSNEVLDNCSLSQSDNMEENIASGTKDETAAELSTLDDKLNEEGPPIDTNASPSENNSTSKCLPFSDPFNSNAKPEENLVEELLLSEHEAPASKDLCPISVLADDAVPNDRTSDKQEHGAMAADSAEEFPTGLSNEVLDNCSLSQSDNMEEILDSGTKDKAAAESSTPADKLIEEGPLEDANASPSENNSASKYFPFGDPFNSSARPEENQVERLLHSDPEAPASRDLCSDDVTSDKQEQGEIAADDAEEFVAALSDEVLDNSLLRQSDNMEENLDSGFKEQPETIGAVIEGVTYGEQESEICPGSTLPDDAVPDDITSDQLEHDAIAADNTEEFDIGLSSEVLANCSVKQSDNMEENLDAGLKEKSETGCIVTEGVTYGEQESESKGLCPGSVFADDAVPNDITLDKLGHGAIAADNAEFGTGSSNEVLDNCSVNQSDNMEEKLDSDFKEQSETRCTVKVGVSYGEQALTVTDYAKEFDAGLSSNVPMEHVEAESGPMEAVYDRDAPTFTNHGEIHAEEYENLEEAASEKTVSSPIKAVPDLQVAEPGSFGDGIVSDVTTSKDGDEEKQGEELKILFATPCHISHSKEDKKASLDGDSREKGLNREWQVSPISGNDTSSLQSSVRDCGEHGQREYLKSLFATPFGSRSSKAEIATCIEINETSSQYKQSCPETENAASSAGNGLTPSVTPLKDTSKDEAGEDLKGLFATPSVVSQSVRGQHFLFQSQLSGEAMAAGEGLGRGLVEDKQGMSIITGEPGRTLFASPVSVKCTNQETTSTKDKYSQSHDMETSICSGVERNLDESEALSVGVDQAPETSHVTAFNYGDEYKQDQLKLLFASPIITETLNQMDGTKRKTEDEKNLLSRNVQGLSHNKGFSVEKLKKTAECTDSKHSAEQIKVEKIIEFAECLKECSTLEEENNESHGNLLSATSTTNSTPLRNDEFSSQEIMIEETAECMKDSSALEAQNNEGQGNILSATSAKNMTPLHNDELSSQQPKIKETAECMKDSSALEEENNEGQGTMLFASSTENMTPLRDGEFSSQEPKTADVAMSGEIVRGTEMNTRHESWVQEIVDIQEHKIEETVVDRDLLLRNASRILEEGIYVEIVEESTSPVISKPTCDIEFPEHQMVPEINQSSPKNVKTSDAFSEGTEDHLKLLFAAPIKETSPSCSESLKPLDACNEENTEDHLKLQFATPIKGTSPSRLDEASSCQLKTAMVINEASVMVGKEPKLKGFEFSGEPLAVEIISGGFDSTKRSCFSKEIKDQSERGPLFPTSSKGTSPLQLEGSPGCEEDIFKDLDGGKFLGSQEQIFAQHEDHQLLNEMTDNTGDATLDWFHIDDGSVPIQAELETQKKNDSAHQFEPLREVTEDDAVAEGKKDDHLMASQESLEDRLINTREATKSVVVSDAVCQQRNILTDIETETITQESVRKTDDISVSAENGILEFDAESTALRSQEKIIITVEETKGDEVQKLEVRNISNAFLHNNIPDNDEYAKESSTVLPADKQFHFPEHYVIENVSSIKEFTSSANECQDVFKEGDFADQGDGLTIFESTERTSTIVNYSDLTTQIDLPGLFAGESGNITHSAFSEELQNESNQGKFSAAQQQDEDSFDKKEHESTQAVLSPSFKCHENISFIEEGLADEDTLISKQNNDLAEKKVPLTPAGVAKTSFAKHLNSTVKKKNARSVLIHGTPNKLSQIADMKENAPSVKGDVGTLTALRPEKRRALDILPRK
ncbi:uncharacterized protein LOC132627346 isoform X2 [Lycium barbarum]|uniref:uncharacterized protein LOC132627346 isoform X2 n=1 Tax=Lycium barbarum TaxID=112863 RepID=UPI00293EFFD0|nr:uncharacterized protein LOC132627346 isoform X2 [Lycium barbarum]